jgi:hypothetical protein
MVVQPSSGTGTASAAGPWMASRMSLIHSAGMNDQAEPMPSASPNRPAVA